MLLTIIRVEPLAEYRLRIEFSDRSVKDVDLRDERVSREDRRRCKAKRLNDEGTKGRRDRGTKERSGCASTRLDD